MEFLSSLILSILIGAAGEVVISPPATKQISPPSTSASAPAQKERHDN